MSWVVASLFDLSAIVRFTIVMSYGEYRGFQRFAPFIDNHLQGFFFVCFFFSALLGYSMIIFKIKNNLFDKYTESIQIFDLANQHKKGVVFCYCSPSTSMCDMHSEMLFQLSLFVKTGYLSYHRLKFCPHIQRFYHC